MGNPLKGFGLAPESFTTPFTPPPSCSTLWTSIQDQKNTAILVQNVLGLPAHTECFAGAGQVYNQCPSGYATATPSITNQQGTSKIICCLVNFAYATDKKHNGWCTSDYNSPPTAVAAVGPGQTSATVTAPILMWASTVLVALSTPASSSFSSAEPTVSETSSSPTDSETNPSSTDFSSSSGFLGSTSYGTSVLISPPSSISLSTLGSSSSSGAIQSSENHTAISTSIPATLSTSAPLVPSSTSPLDGNVRKSTSKHLSPGAKAGISIGVLLAAFLLALLAFLLLRRRKIAKTSHHNFIIQNPSQTSLNDPNPPSESNLTHQIPTTSTTKQLSTTIQQLQPRKSWRIPARFPSWRVRGELRVVGGIPPDGMQEVPPPVSPVSSVSSESSSFRGSRVSMASSLEVKRKELDPISPVSPVAGPVV